MTDNISGASGFDHDVREFVHTRVADPDRTLTCQGLTTEFLDMFEAVYGPLGGWRAAAYMGVAQTIRPILRRAHPDPEDDPAQLDLPETALLQDRYSVPGAGMDGEPAYVPRPRLTLEQMELVVARDRAMSVHYARRADALESWWHRHNAAVA